MVLPQVNLLKKTLLQCVSEITCYPLFISIKFLAVIPHPKVIESPRNVTTVVGSKAVFTCDFEASTNSTIAQVHWELNGTDLAGCRRFKERINCTVTQSFPDTNYISSSLEIDSVQADNVGQYTCYCSYNTRFLNVDGAQSIQSDRKSATLSIHSAGIDIIVQ